MSRPACEWRALTSIDSEVPRYRWQNPRQCRAMQAQAYGALGPAGAKQCKRGTGARERSGEGAGLCSVASRLIKGLGG